MDKTPVDKRSESSDRPRGPPLLTGDYPALAGEIRGTLPEIGRFLGRTIVIVLGPRGVRKIRSTPHWVGNDPEGRSAGRGVIPAESAEVVPPPHPGDIRPPDSL